MKIIPASYEILTQLDGAEILRKIELAGRVCYKSEDKIEDGSAERFVRSIIKRGHESVLEHVSISVRFIVDRGVSHELVRHRVASYSQESTRYCVAGDSLLTTSNPHNKITVRELYENAQKSKNGAWKRIRIRQYDEKDGVLSFANVKNVFSTGVKPCLRIKTKLGYELVCTEDHEVMTDFCGEYTRAGSIPVGASIVVNGTEALYRNRDWLYHQNITLGKTFKEIAEEFGFGVSSLKKWAKKLSIPPKGTGYFNIGRKAWNKGIRDERQVEALRKYHHCGGMSGHILKEDTSRYWKHKKENCEICKKTENLEVHHADKNHSNNDPRNLVTLCESCHQRVHSQNLLTAYKDVVVSIEEAGDLDVFDVEMDSQYHNFVANGVVVHNCNYSKDGFGGEITVIRPCFIVEDWGNAAVAWRRACENAERSYFQLLDMGATPQDARAVLPNSLKTEVVMTCNLREWRHILRLRTDKAAHPQMREVMVPLLKELKERVPVIFDDIGVGSDE